MRTGENIIWMNTVMSTYENCDTRFKSIHHCLSKILKQDDFVLFRGNCKTYKHRGNCKTYKQTLCIAYLWRNNVNVLFRSNC